MATQTLRAFAPKCIFTVLLAAFLLFPLSACAYFNPGARDQADLVVVHKSLRKMELWQGGELLRSYRIALGFTPSGHKQREGDGKTPEGMYAISARNADSAFHLSLRINYPNAEDAARARRARQSPGGDIMIHGLKNGKTAAELQHPRKDWTNGCVAVTNREMEEIWNRVPVGTPVMILP